jgi:hypothetical protein
MFDSDRPLTDCSEITKQGKQVKTVQNVERLTKKNLTEISKLDPDKAIKKLREAKANLTAAQSRPARWWADHRAQVFRNTCAWQRFPSLTPAHTPGLPLRRVGAERCGLARRDIW